MLPPVKSSLSRSLSLSRNYRSLRSHSCPADLVGRNIYIDVKALLRSHLDPVVRVPLTPGKMRCLEFYSGLGGKAQSPHQPNVSCQFSQLSPHGPSCVSQGCIMV